MKKGILLIAILLLLGLASNAFAQETVWDMANSEQYGKKAGGMLGRGLINAATCFVDVIVQTVNGTKEGPPFVGTLTGLGGGIGCTALRATSGVLDVATFWVPGFNGIPVGRSYANCLELEETSSSAPAPSMMESAPTYSTPAMQQPTTVMGEEPQRKHDPMDYVKK